ncbi:MAG: SCO family protein [bacterium]
MKRIFLIAAVVLLSLLLGWLIFGWQPDQPSDQDHQLLKKAEEPVGGDFTLYSERGDVSLKDFREKITLIYFGYTWCPDICPTNLGFISLALNELSAQELAQVQVLFISVDPERDTVKRLAEYVDFFHPSILGITGNDQQVADVARLYGAAYRRAEQDSATGYVVDHSANTYVMNQNGKLSHTLDHATPPDQIVAVIRNLLLEQ